MLGELRTTLAPAMRPAFRALAACLLLALAACGGDDDADDAAFISQVTAICAEYRPKLEFLQPPVEFLDEWGRWGPTWPICSKPR